MDHPTNTLTMDQAEAMEPEALAELPVDQLAALRATATEWQDALKALQAKLQHALEVKFADREKAARSAKGQETGRVTVREGGHDVVIDVPKSVEWSQDGLRKVEAAIREEGQEPGAFLTYKLGIPEKKFASLPPKALEAAKEARTVKHGNRKITIQEAKD